MATLNQICIPAGKVIDDIVDLTSLEKALELSSLKYNTTLKADADSVFITPEILADAVLMVNCEITESCKLPTVLEAEQYTFKTGCKVCLTDLTPNERKAFGISTGDPVPTPKYEDRHESAFEQNLLVSTRKINWLGNTAYTGANLAVPALLPNYKLVDGIWTKLVAMSPAVPHYTGIIAGKNAQTTKALQTTWTSDEVLDVLDGMLALQSDTMMMIPNTQKTVAVTNEMYDIIIHTMTREGMSLCCMGEMKSQVEGGVTIQTIMYGDLQIIRYNELSSAIRDLALVGTAWNLPNRAVLMLGLPNVSYMEQGDFKSDFDEVTSNYKASLSLTTAIVDPYPADFYVIGY